MLEFVQAGGALANFWAHVGGMRLRRPFVSKKKRARVRHFVALERIEYAGERETYDIEVDGPYHNFVANGFVVDRFWNSASSRAVPTNKMVERVVQNPAMPVEWGVNKAGMSASETLTAEQEEEAKAGWLRARDSAVGHVRDLQRLNVHKQVINRIMEPFMWHTVIVTATRMGQFFQVAPGRKCAARDSRRRATYARCDGCIQTNAHCDRRVASTARTRRRAQHADRATEEG